ncbi:MAG: polysaccharide deacetylase family protein [Bacilli bacterium]|nr:polysaccharide deacetylase family protein [Bacilli bacterium]MDD4706021.1 polysaccharide deacetylase family protein [Bacilli bacterium]
MKNIFTIDLEEYYCCNLGNNDVLKSSAISTIEKNTDNLLNLLKKHNVKATFFVLGSIAELYPEIIKKIYVEGHEIASHGYGHELVYSISKEEFKADIVKSKQILEGIIKEPVNGYRAPSWSITEKSLWALPILEQCGYKYSSSIFPIKTFLYGIKNAPKIPNYPVINNKQLKILEIPPSSHNFIFKELGFSGGFYFRVFPFFLIKWLIKIKNKNGIPVVCYIHPWEIDPETPKLELKGFDKIIHYYGIKKCYNKLDKLLSDFKFTTIKDVYINKK